MEGILLESLLTRAGVIIAVLASLRYVFLTVFEHFYRNFVASVEISGDDEAYDFIHVLLCLRP